MIRLRKVRCTTRERDERNPVMAPRISGRGAYGGVVSSDSIAINVHYNCLRTGTVRTGLDLLVDVVTLKDDASRHAVRNPGQAATEELGVYGVIVVVFVVFIRILVVAMLIEVRCVTELRYGL